MNRLRLLMRISRSGVPSSQCVRHLSGNGSLAIDPASLRTADVGRLFEAPKDVIETLQFASILPSKYKKQIDTLEECVYMCRTPFLEVVHYLKGVKRSVPCLRVLLWGKFGTGKTITLCQTLHYAHTQNWIVFHVPSAMSLTRPTCDIQMSSHKSGRIDTPDLAVEMLKLFKHQNAKSWQLISKLHTERDYKWSKAEVTAASQPLTDIVEMGISAPIYACDCVGGLLRELRRHSSSGDIRLLLAVDYANSLYGKSTVKRADRTFASSDDLTLVEHIRRTLSPDWSNGACVLVADAAEVSKATDKFTVPLYTPLELFGEQGFEAITPFIPVQTTLYSQKEIDAMYDYYKDKRWITTDIGRSERGRLEMTYLSAFNPHLFERLCAIV